jgi:hypothetical protein
LSCSSRRIRVGSNIDSPRPQDNTAARSLDSMTKVTVLLSSRYNLLSSGVNPIVRLNE